MYPNRFDGTCIRCQARVPAGTGAYRFDGAHWVVRHPGGRCHTPQYTEYVVRESAEWQRRRHLRMVYAEGRCEWRSLLHGRCPSVGPLDCHHRHYRNLGSEPLSDLIVLCPPHHEIADRRRRFWGAWPLLGRPLWRPAGPSLRAVPPAEPAVARPSESAPALLPPASAGPSFPPR